MRNATRQKKSNNQHPMLTFTDFVVPGGRALHILVKMMDASIRLIEMVEQQPKEAP